MPDYSFHVPSLAVTNPIWLWLFKHGWEDPSWGRLPINQAALGLALHGISERVADRRLQADLQKIAQAMVSENAREAVEAPKGRALADA
jgi:hypothetical protein